MNTTGKHLLPCPFCGGDARADSHADDCYFTLHRALNKAPDGDASLQLEVLEAWNRRAAIEARAAVPAGWPTNEMIEAGRKAAMSHGPLLGNGQSLWHIFRDMLAAAPQPVAQPSEKQGSANA